MMYEGTPDALTEVLAQMNAASAAERATERGETPKQEEQLNNDTTPDTSEQELADDEGLEETPATGNDSEDDDGELDIDDGLDDDHPATGGKHEAPAFWKAEDREAFASLPPKAQELMLKIENERTRYTDSKVNEAAATRKAAEERIQHIEGVSQQVEQLLDGRVKEYQERYANIDWPAFYRTDPQTAQIWEAHAKAEAMEIQAGHQRLQQARQVRQQEISRLEGEKLQKMINSDPKLSGLKNKSEVEALTKWALGKYTQQEIENLTANQVAMGYLAWKADRALDAKANKVIVHKTQNKPTPKMTTASSASTGQTTVPSDVARAQRAFDKNPTDDNMLRLMNAQTAANRAAAKRRK